MSNTNAPSLFPQKICRFSPKNYPTNGFAQSAFIGATHFRSINLHNGIYVFFCFYYNKHLMNIQLNKTNAFYLCLRNEQLINFPMDGALSIKLVKYNSIRRKHVEG